EGQLLTVGAQTPLARNLTLHGALRLDRHEDDFVLDRHRPEWFHNHHVTKGALIDLSLRGSWNGWSWAAGVEAARDDIVSSNLGDHDQKRRALFAEVGRLSGPLTFAVQGRVDNHDSWGTITTGAVSGRWRFHSGWALRASWGQSFRAPSFTDLYYSSPSTTGNTDLEPEQGHTVEIGLEGSHVNLTIFRREAKPLIDYLLHDDGVWRAENVGRLTTDGIEAGLNLPITGVLEWQRLGVTWLDSNVEVDPTRSRYALAHPRLQAAWTGGAEHRDLWRAGWALRYRQPANGGSWTTLDLRLGRRILSQMWLDLEADNVFDRSITEVSGVPLPGRWVTLTVTWRSDSR
ncbi:MAG: TonB-dependent receptor, partial [Acidobacteriota bacterium]